MATVISPVSRIVGCFYPQAPGGAYAGQESRAPVRPFEKRAGTQQQRHDNDIDPHARSHHLRRRPAHVTLLPAPVSLTVRLGPGPVPERGVTDEEGSRLAQIVRRGKHGPVRVRRVMIMVSASDMPLPAIARLAVG